jgi:hypothetical protein
MTGRERLGAVLRKQPTDRLPWTTLVSNETLALLPEDLSGKGGIAVAPDRFYAVADWVRENG